MLLDTNILLWLLLGDPRLSQRNRGLLQEAEELYVSVVSFWEIGIKMSGKGFNDLQLPDDWQTVFKEAIDRFKIDLVSISITDCKLIEDLPFYHKDPFDRMIIAQASSRDLAVMTSDKVFKEYDVEMV